MIGLSARAILSIAIVVLGGLAAGCAHAPEESSPAPTTFSASALAEDVLALGYATIADRYIEPISIGAVAMDGIEGLRTLDRGIRVRWQAGSLVLTAGDKEVLRHALPDSEDAKGWAALTVWAWEAGCQNSQGLAAVAPEQVYEAIFDSSLARLDRYSKHASAREALSNRTRRYGRGGIGADFKLDGGKAQVTDVQARGPAANAGLHAGDWVTHIDEASVAGLSKTVVAERLGGPAGSWVTLTVRRPPTRVPMLLRVHREHIVAETVAATRENGIVYVDVNGFNQGTVGHIWSLLDEATRSPDGEVRGGILDLRGNPGGLLQQSVRVADLFLDSGPVIATRGRHPDSIQRYEASASDILSGLPMDVLIDGGSASAAEIVAAALQDRSRALVIGTSSYGKGVVQTVVGLPNNGQLILTWSRLISPSGRVLQGRGVSPTISTSGMDRDGASDVARVLALHMKAPHDGNSPRPLAPHALHNPGKPPWRFKSPNEYCVTGRCIPRWSVMKCKRPKPYIDNLLTVPIASLRCRLP